MRVAIDEQIFAIQYFGGISRLFAELSKQFTTDESVDVRMLPLDVPVVNRYLLDDPRLRQALRVSAAHNSYTALGRYFLTRRPSDKVDIIHNTFYLPHGLTGFRGARRVVTIHDMIPEMLPQTRRRLDFITLKRRYVDAADHIICVSENTKSDLVRIYGTPNAPITVIHHGVDPMFRPGVERPPGLPSRYLLFVGNRNQYKDAPALIRAFARISSEYPDLSLLFIGGGSLTRRERHLVRSLSLEGRVHQFALPDGLMPAIYGNAEVCVFPSRFEGFGLPALEAMACGTPTVLASSSALPEVGGDAAVYFTPGDDQELSDRIRDIVRDAAWRRDLSEEGRRRAARFTWKRCAEDTASVYRSIVD